MLLTLFGLLSAYIRRPTPDNRSEVIEFAKKTGLSLSWDPQTQSFLGTVAGTKRTAFLYDVQVENKHYATLVIES
jgi:hypothetical protein